MLASALAAPALLAADMPVGVADPDLAIADPGYSDPVFFWRMTSMPPRSMATKNHCPRANIQSSDCGRWRRVALTGNRRAALTGRRRKVLSPTDKVRAVGSRSDPQRTAVERAAIRVAAEYRRRASRPTHRLMPWGLLNVATFQPTSRAGCNRAWSGFHQTVRDWTVQNAGVPNPSDCRACRLGRRTPERAQHPARWPSGIAAQPCAARQASHQDPNPASRHHRSPACPVRFRRLRPRRDVCCVRAKFGTRVKVTNANN
jgi:hypothetical protein